MTNGGTSLQVACMVHTLPQFFIENFPTGQEILLIGPLFLLWALGSLWLAGWLKRDKNLQTGYTRKIFHFLIFSSAAGIQAFWGVRLVCLFGGMTSLVIFYAVLRGNGHLLYEALAREKDTPHRTYYILTPYVATLLGGLSSNILFSEAALAGYLVAGLGDAVGEPVGTRFGKHTYRVPSFKGVPAIRSYEGSAAVCVISLVATIIAFSISPHLIFPSHALLIIPAIALLSAFLEAVSPHGWDNAVMQVVPSLCVALLACP